MEKNMCIICVTESLCCTVEINTIISQHFNKMNFLKICSISLIIREMQIKTAMRYHFTMVRITIIKKSTNKKCWRGCGEKQTLLHCWQECKLVQRLRKAATPTLGGGSKITADGDCSHEIKRCLLLGRKAMTSLDSVLKNRHITLPTKVHLVKAMVFPVVMDGSESWTIKKVEH